MPYETSNGCLSGPEARGLEWLSEKLADEGCLWTLHKSGLVSTIHGRGAGAVVIVLNVRWTVKNWSKDREKHIHVYVLPMWYEDCLDSNVWLAPDPAQLVCVRSPGSPTATDACVSMVMAADNDGVGLSEVKTIREAISNQQQTDKALMDSALLSAKELFLKTELHPELRKAWSVEDYHGARLAYNSGYYEVARSILRDSSSTLEKSNLKRTRRLYWLIRINELGREIAKHPGMPEDIYCKVLELCKDEDWDRCETQLVKAQQALEDWRVNQKRRAALKQVGVRKLRAALKFKAKYPDHHKLRGLCEGAVGLAEAGDWEGSLELLEQVSKLRSRLEWDDVVEEAWRKAQTGSW